jgi:hypothetical protein
MPNTIKYSTTGDTLSLKKGNFFIGTGDVGKGPTSATTYWNGITPPSGGYSVYKNKVSNGPAIWTAASDNQLVSLTNNIEGTSFTTVQQCINYFATQSDKMVLNKDYERIITNGLVLNVDAGFLPSYGGSGTTWYDLAYSGNNGTLTNGPTYSSLDGGYITFDGVDDYVNFSGISLTTSSFSCESLFQWSTVGGNRGTLHSLSYQYPSSGYLIRQADTNNNRIVVWSDYGTETYVLSNASIPTSAWTHVTVVQNSNNCSIYINGVLDSTQSLNNPVINTTYPYRIGQRGTSGAFLPGRIAFSKIYNKALTQSEVTQNYNASISRFNTSNIVKNGLVLNLDSSNTVSYPTSGTTWTDLSGYGYHGTLINGPTFDSTSKSIVFDGTNDYVSCGTQIGNFGTSNFTINFLFKTGEQSAPSTFVAKSIGSNPTSDYGWLVNNGSDGTNLGFAIASDNVNWGTNGSYVIQTSGATINNNTWQMATIVGDRAQPNVSIYLNGVLQNLKSYVATTAPFTSLGNVTNDKIFAIGSESDISSSPFPIEANIEALRIYDRSLSQSEVLQNYYQSSIVTNGLTMYLDADNVVSYVGTGTTWKDLTTNGNNGTLVNGPTYTTTNGPAFVFDDTNDYMSTPYVVEAATSSNLQTLCSWVYGTGTDNSFFGTNANSTGKFHIILNYQSNGQLRFGESYYGGGGGVQDQTNTVSVSSNPTWNFACIVKTAAGIYDVYYNGVKVISNATKAATGSSNLALGTWWSGFYAPSTTSLLYTYNRALSAEEIAQNYNAHKYRFGL